MVCLHYRYNILTPDDVLIIKKNLITFLLQSSGLRLELKEQEGGMKFYSRPPKPTENSKVRGDEPDRSVKPTNIKYFTPKNHNAHMIILMVK